MELSPLISCQIFGWLAQPRTTLVWEDIKAKGLTWPKLRALGFEPEDLKKIQPDKTEWVRRGGIRLQDLPEAKIFPINPLTDFRVDLGELWKMQCDAQTMSSMGITYDQLHLAGITPKIMYYFNFSLCEWYEVGFRSKHLPPISEDDAMLVFKIDKTEVDNIFKSFEIRQSSYST